MHVSIYLPPFSFRNRNGRLVASSNEVFQGILKVLLPPSPQCI